MRALSYDLEEKKVRIEAKGEQLSIEADEQLLRQVIVQFAASTPSRPSSRRRDSDRRATARLAPRHRSRSATTVPECLPERASEIFKPYFTTQQKGTGLGLAIVQQIVLAHGWEIECLANEPKGAIFRITHLNWRARRNRCRPRRAPLD